MKLPAPERNILSASTVILGAGPAGLGAALQLARRGLGRVTVLEQHSAVGGNAGSFLLDGVYADYGSHRLHPACDPEILRDLKQLLGDDLLLRPRHGRIRLRGRWIHFPLHPLDLALRLPPSFLLGAASDLVRKRITAPTRGADTFASVLERGLGRTICHDFYFPYARKIWGAEPEALSPVQARRRVSGSSPGKLLRKIAGAIPGLKPPGAGQFYYPRRGYGQIPERLGEAVSNAGGELVLDARVTRLKKAGPVWRVHYLRQGQPCAAESERVWSTLPIDVLARCLVPSPPPEVLNAAGRIAFRAMILIYLVLEQDRFSEFDAHYFPEPAVPLTRLSEPKNYSAAAEPRGVTVLCGELPCDIDSGPWRAMDRELGNAMLGWLAAADLPVRARVRRVVTRRLPYAYPLYTRGYEEFFEIIDRWLSGLDGLLTFGRQGLFAHDNLHHALYMGYCAADCVGADGAFDHARWAGYRNTFASHVVED